jgi:hypothetical protein
MSNPPVDPPVDETTPLLSSGTEAAAQPPADGDVKMEEVKEPEDTYEDIPDHVMSVSSR